MAYSAYMTLHTHTHTHTQELLKYTDESHPDYAHVLAAQKAMRDVAMLINEQKRRMENIGKIGRWQETIENWKVCMAATCTSVKHIKA